MAFETLDDVLVDMLKDLYNAEKQLVKALPKMAKAARNEELSEAFEEHAEVTRGHVERLEEVFSVLGIPAKGKACEAMEGLIAEAEEIIKDKKESTEAAFDAALIAAAQKVEHYEMAGYGSARTWAEVLGNESARNLLQETLDEESETNEKLTQLAETVNEQACEGVESGEEDEEEEDVEVGSSRSSRGGMNQGRGRSSMSGGRRSY